jgi:cytochrome c oxidase subunit 2
VAEKQRTLFYIIFWAAVFVFILVEGILVYTVLRYRRRAGQQLPSQTHGNTTLEIGWTIAPAIVLAVIAVPTMIYIFDIAKDPGPDALVVNVTGHQWWWEFEYPQQNVVTANELHVPVDVPVKLNLKSDDVIHSFWVPKLAGKQDVVPNNDNSIWFKARKKDIDTFPAVFYGQCAEFCGVAHANMRLRVIVHDSFEDTFDDWVTAYHLPQRPAVGEAAEGAVLFASRGCLLCHKADGPAPAEVRQSLKEAFERGELRFPAPNLTKFATRSTFVGGTMELNRDNLVKWLADPDELKPGNRMAQLANVYRDPGARLSREDVEKLASYLLSLE